MSSKTKSSLYRHKQPHALRHRCIVFITTHGSISLVPNFREVEKEDIPYEVGRFTIPQSKKVKINIIEVAPTGAVNCTLDDDIIRYMHNVQIAAQENSQSNFDIFSEEIKESIKKVTPEEEYKKLLIKNIEYYKGQIRDITDEIDYLKSKKVTGKDVEKILELSGDRERLKDDLKVMKDALKNPYERFHLIKYSKSRNMPNKNYSLTIDSNTGEYDFKILKLAVPNTNSIGNLQQWYSRSNISIEDLTESSLVMTKSRGETYRTTTKKIIEHIVSNPVFDANTEIEILLVDFSCNIGQTEEGDLISDFQAIRQRSTSATREEDKRNADEIAAE